MAHVNAQGPGNAEPDTTTAPPPAATNVRGAAVHLGVSPSTIRRLTATGELRAVRIGGRVLYRYDDLTAYLAEAARTWTEATEVAT